SVTFWDRRPRLLVRPRKGSTHNPYKLCPTAQGGLAFLGGIEVYNLSGRPNAIRGYAFWQKNDDGAWIVMESQNYKESSEDETFRTKPRLLLPHIPERRFGFLHLRRSSTGRLRCRSALRSKIYSESGTASRSSRMTRCTSKKHLFPAGRKGVVFSFGARASWPTFPVSRRVLEKGMSRENTSPLPHGDGEGRCLTSSPCAALLWSVALRGIPVHQLLRSSCRAGAPASSVAAMCQPWFYRRLEAYGFVGLSEGAYG